MRDLLELFLHDEGHRVVTANDGIAALDLVAHRSIQPDLLLADYNLPGELNGLQLAIQLRHQLSREVPVIILTGDISAEELRDVLPPNCGYFNKPIGIEDLSLAVQRVLPPMPPLEHTAVEPSAAEIGPAIVFIVDDERHVRDAMREVLEATGYIAHAYATGEAFLEAYHATPGACILIDAKLPGMSGFDLLRRLHDGGDALPTIMVTGQSDVASAVVAMKAGASDFIEKPVSRNDLLESVARALERSRDRSKIIAWRETAAQNVASLTSRQRQIMDLVLAGHPSKNIAADLKISQRTVENHRASIMRKTGASSLPALARMAVAAAGPETLAGPSVG